MEVYDIDYVKLNNSVVALGKFEGLHRGHMLLIDRVVKLGIDNGFTSAVCTIEFPMDKQINLFDERYDILEKCKVHALIRCPFTKEFSAMEPLTFFEDIIIGKLGAKCIVVGSDFCFGYKRKGNVDTLKEFGLKYGVEVVVIDKLSIDGKEVSTSFIKDFIANGNIARANEFLGRCYSISGKVVKGRQLGSTIGFPTANIMPDDKKLLPRFAVYKSKVLVAGKIYDALTNVGDNPTVSSKSTVTVESFIKDFDDDIYGSDITVFFTDFIRDEIKFSSIDELVLQMNKDLTYI